MDSGTDYQALGRSLLGISTESRHREELRLQAQEAIRVSEGPVYAALSRGASSIVLTLYYWLARRLRNALG